MAGPPLGCGLGPHGALITGGKRGLNGRQCVPDVEGGAPQTALWWNGSLIGPLANRPVQSGKRQQLDAAPSQSDPSAKGHVYAQSTGGARLPNFGVAFALAHSLSGKCLPILTGNRIENASKTDLGAGGDLRPRGGVPKGVSG